MFSSVFSTILLAFVTTAVANNSPVSYSTSSAAYDHTVSGTYTTGFAPPIYTCVVYVNASTSSGGPYVSATSGGVPQYNISSTSYYNPNATYVYTSSTSAAAISVTSSSPASVKTSVTSAYATPSSVRFSVSTSSAPTDSVYITRPLTSIVYATLVTTDATVSTVYASPTPLLNGYPSGLPVCTPYGDAPQVSVSVTSAGGSQPSADALQANSKAGENKPSTGFAIKNNIAGITFGAVAGMALVML